MNKISGFFEWINKNWPVLGAGLSLLVVLIGWLFFGISLSQPFDEIRAKQKEYKYKEGQRVAQKRMVERHLGLGKTFLDNSRYKAAKKEFESVLKLDKMNPKAQLGMFKVGVFEAMEKNFIPEVIERQIDLILKESRDDPHALTLLANLHAQLEEPDKAEKLYEKAIKKDKTIASAWFGLGVLYQEKNELERALEKYKEAVALSRLNERYLNNLASIYTKKGDYENAVKYYERVLTLDYEYILPNLEISLAFRLMKDHLDMASDYQYKILGMLDDEKFTDLDKNQDGWFFPAGDGNVSLHDFAEKKSYALYSLSITLFLQENESEAAKYAELAQSITIDQKDSLIALARFDLKTLTDKHSSYNERAEQYKQKYLQ